MANWKPLFYRGIDFSDRYMISDEGEIFSIKSKKNLKQTPMNGYLGCVVSLGKRGQQKAIKIHIAVAENFIPNDDKAKDTVNHKDGNKQNNCSSNLEWLTIKENVDHAVASNLCKTKKIRCKTTGVIFKSFADAARWCGLTGKSPFLEYFKKGTRKTCGKHPTTNEPLVWELV